MNDLCVQCSKPLNMDEKYYLEIRCSDCELEHNDAINRWVNGEENSALDKLYGAKTWTANGQSTDNS